MEKVNFVPCERCRKADRHVRHAWVNGWFKLVHYWCEPRFDDSRLIRKG